MVKEIETKVICKQKGRYIGWPTVGRTSDGKIYALFSGDRDAHVCPFGKSYIVSSEDEGVSWSEPKLVNNTPFDDRDTGLCILPDDTLVMTWFTSHYHGQYSVSWTEKAKIHDHEIRSRQEWQQQVHSVTPENSAQWAPHLRKAGQADSRKFINASKEYGCDLYMDSEDRRYPPTSRRRGFWTRRSPDGGQTWDEPTPAPVSSPHGPNLLPDGNLIYIGSLPYQDQDGSSLLGVAVSSDRGVSWDLAAIINASPEYVDWETKGEAPRLCEPHVAAAPSGKLVGMARCQVKDNTQRYLWQFESTDGGTTWSTPVQTEVQGFPPHLLNARDGRLLVSSAIRHDPPGERFCFSHDEGQTWDVANQLELKNAPCGDLGYPSTVELGDNKFLSVYYRREFVEEKPCLMMTRWQG